MSDFSALLTFIRSRYPDRERVGLHEPVFGGNERAYVLDALDSTFVSSVGAYVDRFEAELARITGAPHVVATVNGTTALHMALLLAGAGHGDMVLTQPLSFVATANAIAHCGAVPAFVDVERETLGMSPAALEAFIDVECEPAAGGPRHRASGRRVAACVPMHTFGHPCRIQDIAAVCRRHGIPLVEDAAEALGSTRHGRHCGTFGLMGVLSFNGNKIATAGGGGAILCADQALARRARHLTTTAKVPHPQRFSHDAVGYNYRLPNLNAALACGQLERLDDFLADKRALAQDYAAFCAGNGCEFVAEPAGCRSNYWLNAVLADDETRRDALLTAAAAAGVQARPAWDILADLPMYAAAPRGPLPLARDLAARLVNIPSGARCSAPRRGLHD